ncbi:twisted gastrulation protein homolog 1-A-like [Styela clava]|uniref:twisted gastrulation protein homolog 1-A-like n=1 Tax=Styela clava TaxID=7725 RepID=UPI00193971CD|nr:twisted gastrulation protein homolog 1-A-like [Styela clava]
MRPISVGYICTVVILMTYFVGIQASSEEIDRSRTRHFEHAHRTCNKKFCVSVVSYCTLQDKCYCNPKVNCSCCRECAICMGKFYEHCCDCVGMCEKNVSALLPTMMSTLNTLPDPNPELFRALTDEPIPQLKYQIVKFPVMGELAFHHHKNSDDTPIVIEHVSGKGWTYSGMSATEYWEHVQEELHGRGNFTEPMLCTVSYFDKCISLEECHMSCDSMGAASFRWFHNGCCECVGPSCLNSGNAYPKCKACTT